jgi:hypothetical protein
MSLISIIRESSTPISLGNLGSNSLEHFFGHARVHCRNINIINKMLMAFSSKAKQISTRSFLELLNTIRGRHGMAIVCDPWSESPDSELMSSPYDLAISLLEEIGLDLTRIPGEKPPPSSDDSISPAPAWCCLLQLPAFSAPNQSSSARGTPYSFSVNLRRNTGKLQTGGIIFESALSGHHQIPSRPITPAWHCRSARSTRLTLRRLLFLDTTG